MKMYYDSLRQVSSVIFNACMQIFGKRTGLQFIIKCIMGILFNIQMYKVRYVLES